MSSLHSWGLTILQSIDCLNECSSIIFICKHRSFPFSLKRTTSVNLIFLFKFWCRKNILSKQRLIYISAPPLHNGIHACRSHTNMAFFKTCQRTKNWRVCTINDKSNTFCITLCYLKRTKKKKITESCSWKSKLHCHTFVSNLLIAFLLSLRELLQ